MDTNNNEQTNIIAEAGLQNIDEVSNNENQETIENNSNSEPMEKEKTVEGGEEVDVDTREASGQVSNVYCHTLYITHMCVHRWKKMRRRRVV